MEAGAKGCEIEISGKLVSERARTEKFVAGTMVHTGDPAYSMVRKGFDIAIKKLGVLGVSVRIIPPDVVLPDEFEVKDVKVEVEAEAETKAEAGVEEAKVEAPTEGAVNENEGDTGDEQRGEAQKADGA
jgi:small subunit ribosomal protein S3